MQKDSEYGRPRSRKETTSQYEVAMDHPQILYDAVLENLEEKQINYSVVRISAREQGRLSLRISGILPPTWIGSEDEEDFIHSISHKVDCTLRKV